MYRNDRGSRGGGVAILFRQSLQITKMHDIRNFEGIFCKAYYGKTRYVIGAIYRPPYSSMDVLDELHNYLVAHVKPEDRIILAGDFNLPHVNWPSFSLQQPNYKIGEKMIDIAFSFDLMQIVDEFTRIQANSCSILDLFFISGSISAQASCSVLPGISDHQAVILTLSDVVLKKNCKRVSFPNFSRADDTSILDLLSFEFDSFSSCTTDIHYLWKRFKDIINECIDRFVPRIVKKSKEPLDFSGNVAVAKTAQTFKKSKTVL